LSFAEDDGFRPTLEALGLLIGLCRRDEQSWVTIALDAADDNQGTVPLTVQVRSSTQVEGFVFTGLALSRLRCR
jgi:hypothetical protein